MTKTLSTTLDVLLYQYQYNRNTILYLFSITLSAQSMGNCRGHMET